jgi:chorismate dehydratase
LSKLRISIVQYLNTAPLVWGFTNGPLRGKYDLSFTVPSQCADALRTGVVDLAIIPAIELQRIPDLVVLPDLAIASKQRVRSLLLIAKKPIEQVRRIALDRSSRSTQALTRILCAKLWRIAPEFLEAEPDLSSMLQHADAALLIGDPALRLSILGLAAADNAAHRGTVKKSGNGEQIGSAACVYDCVYDIVEEWRRLTNLPAVLAVWASRPDVVTPEVTTDFATSRDFGISRLDEICAMSAPQLRLPERELRLYLERNIDYALDRENLQGLQAFFDHSAALGLIGSVRPISLARSATLIGKPL